MSAYLSAPRFADAVEVAPELAIPHAGYVPELVWKALRSKGGFNEQLVVPYLLFPLDQRWLYYEQSDKLLNRPRPELAENLVGNEFLVTVPQPRRASETRPLLARTAVDLHLHDRGSVCLPKEVRAGSLLMSEPQANLAPVAWRGRGAV